MILKKFINKIITKVYFLTKNEVVRLALLNICTKFFVDTKNKIEYDSGFNLFWLKNKSKYLLPVENPYFDFDEKEIDRRVLDIFCQKYIPKKGDVIINIGAGIGEELSFFLKKIEENGRLFNIEASPLSFEKLKMLCEKNNYSQCRNFNLAISDNNGEKWIEECSDYFKNRINSDAKGTKVHSYTLDKFVADNGIGEINFLKVNIEGAELQMIDGMRDSVKLIENIAISCHDFLIRNSENEIKTEVEAFLSANNFEIFERNTGNEVLDSWLYAKRLSDRM